MMFGSGRRQAEAQRAIQATAWGTWGDETGSGGTYSGSVVTTDSALQLLAVYGCVAFIANGISTLPVDVFRQRPDGRRDIVGAPMWLEHPTADLDRIAWTTQILTSLLLDGNAYCRKVYSGGMLAELVPLNPATVKVTREPSGGTPNPAQVAGTASGLFKTFRINGVRIDSNEILHIPGVMYPGADTGLSPVEASRQTIGTGMATEEFAGRFFLQGANLGGVIEDPGQPDPDRATLMAKTWARLHSGNRKAHMPGVLQGGAQWKSTGVTNEQAQFLQSRGFTAAQIASHMFLIDPSEFGFQPERGSAITYGNLEQRNARKVQVTFLPWIVRVEEAFSQILPQGITAKINVNALLRGDTLTRYQTYQAASIINSSSAAIGLAPVLDTAEMREAENMPPYSGPVTTSPVPATPEVPV